MHWLRENAFLSGWFALPVAILATIAQNRGKPIKEVDWTWAMIYCTFGIALGVALTPTFDTSARDFAKFLAYTSFFSILFGRASRNIR